MIDKSRPPLDPKRRRKRQTLPAFTPVPRLTTRHDGWTPERQRGFIEALADTGSVKHAAHAVNMTPEGAYLLRRHPEATSFRRAWEAALSLGVQRLEDVAMERALHGVEQPVYSYGKLIGTRRVVNDALLMFLLRNRAPHRFTADSVQTLDAASQSSLKRLKREWRAEWEKERTEQAAREQAPDAIADRLDQRIAGLHTQWVQDMNPETLRYYLAFRLALRAQRNELSLAELEVDPLAPDFDAGAILMANEANLPTHIRERTQELGGDMDTARSYCAPRLSWRDEEDDDEEEEE
ncbi:hypothetical protein HNO88_003452 [Novosphingobium chloroacetimidivorans]|uniref:Uncharacterized protein n=1 Tax=Novosphingobium chloroacetimidivorans TaxID=1428314 RepID=A0A7W7KC79_9SPHN|nr:hypothetical protein [Novosphingobium chloroacetimidivorans]MBB4860111.1 hypothetical protein [Novosphingobium chloroacetimidivorans]